MTSCEFYKNLYEPKEPVIPFDMDASYTVRHLLQNINDNGYSCAEVEEYFGTAGQYTNAIAKSYTGFKVQEFYQQIISDSNTTVVQIFYNRNTYSVTFLLDGGEGTTSFTGRYGKKIEINSPRKLGYEFAGWDDVSTEKTDLYPSDNLGTISDIEKSYKAIWNANSGIPYTVNHYRQILGENEYTLFEAEWKYGTVDEETEATAKNYEGFSVKPFEQKIIKVDNSTVVSIYYDRIAYTLSLDLNYDENVDEYKITAGMPVEIETPEREGWIFIGWNPPLPAKMPANDFKSKAEWCKSTAVLENKNIELAINIEEGSSEKECIFSVPAEYDYYYWAINGIVQTGLNCNSNIFTYDFSTSEPGSYVITVYVVSERLFYSANTFYYQSE